MQPLTPSQRRTEQRERCARVNGGAGAHGTQRERRGADCSYENVRHGEGTTCAHSTDGRRPARLDVQICCRVSALRAPLIHATGSGMQRRCSRLSAALKHAGVLSGQRGNHCHVPLEGR